MKFLDLVYQYKLIKKEIDNSVKRVLDKGIFIGGEEVEKFEKEMTKFCGVKYAISVNSCTDALFLSLKALGIKEGDEVITSPFTFIATTEAIANVGAKPVFVDIDSQTFNIDPLKIKQKITKRTKAILPIHLFGQMADMTEIMKIAKKYKLYVVEDAAQAIGSKHNDKKAGSIGDLVCFSFFPSKNLAAFGDGGAIITNNKKLADKIHLLKNHGSSKKDKYLNLILGTNSRLDSIQAAILRVKLKHLDQWNKKRQENAKYYKDRLCNVQLPHIAAGNNHVFHQYTVIVDSKIRARLIKYLKDCKIPTMIYYSMPLHLQPALKYLGYKKNDFPETEKTCKEVLSLPIYPELSKKNQDFIIRKIKEFYKK